jgi:hypothetical protein
MNWRMHRTFKDSLFMLSFQGWIKEKAVRRRILMNAFSLHAKSTCLNSIEKNLSPETWKFVLRRHRPDGLKEEEEAACNDFNFFIDQSHTALFAALLGKVLQQHAILEEDCSNSHMVQLKRKERKKERRSSSGLSVLAAHVIWSGNTKQENNIRRVMESTRYVMITVGDRWKIELIRGTRHVNRINNFIV